MYAKTTCTCTFKPFLMPLLKHKVLVTVARSAFLADSSVLHIVSLPLAFNSLKLKNKTIHYKLYLHSALNDMISMRQAAFGNRPQTCVSLLLLSADTDRA